MSLLSLAKLTLTAHLNPISNSSSCREAPSHLSLIQFDWPSLWAMLDGTLCEVDRAFYPALVEGDLSVHFWLCSEKNKLVKRSCLCHCVPPRGRLSDNMNNLPFIDISDTQRRDRVEITGLCRWIFSNCLRNMSHKCKWFVFTLFDLEMISRLYFFLEMHESDNLHLCPSWALCGLHLIWKLVNCLRSLSRSDREGAEISF